MGAIAQGDDGPRRPKSAAVSPRNRAAGGAGSAPPATRRKKGKGKGKKKPDRRDSRGAKSARRPMMRRPKQCATFHRFAFCC
jgi:hypothetical protein